MKYNVPYGLADEVTWGDTPYVNGDPSIGRAGSIPPAASIEYPQREIVNLIKGSAAAALPTNSDLSQLARGVQAGLNFAIAAGTPNGISVNLGVSPLIIHEGFVLWVRTIAANTDAVSVNVNALGGMQVLLMDGTPIRPAAWGPNWYLGLVADNNGHWILFSASAAVIGGVTKLIANRDFYVDAALGNDTYNGAAPTLTAGTTNGPFKTIQKGVTTVGQIDLNGYTARVHVADGTYNEAVVLPGVSINGGAELIGNDTNWGNVFINGPAGTSGLSSAIGSGAGNFSWTMHGFKLGSQGHNANGTDWGNAIWIHGGGQAVWYWNIEFAACPGANASHIFAQASGSCIYLGPSYGGGSLKISGGASVHVQSSQAYVSQLGAGSMSIVGTPAFGFYAQAAFNGTITQVYSSISGAGSGSKYNVFGNGVINFQGNNPATYYPVPGAGTASSGGQAI
jgi:hypothetical protein